MTEEPLAPVAEPRDGEVPSANPGVDRLSADAREERRFLDRHPDLVLQRRPPWEREKAPYLQRSRRLHENAVALLIAIMRSTSAKRKYLF